MYAGLGRGASHQSASKARWLSPPLRGEARCEEDTAPEVRDTAGCRGEKGDEGSPPDTGEARWLSPLCGEEGSPPDTGEARWLSPLCGEGSPPEKGECIGASHH